MDIFKKKKNVKDEIIHILESMEGLSPDSEEYAKMAKNLETVCSAGEKHGKNKSSLVGPILTVGGSIITVFMIVYSEETRIITSKALGFVVKGRV